MRTAMCPSAFLRLLFAAVLLYYSASLAAAPAVLLEKAKLVPSDGAPEGGFGRAIAIDGNIAVVTANAQRATRGADDDMPSAAYVFERSAAGVWNQTAKLSSGIAGDLYGIDVAVEGNLIVVGAVFSGLAYVYEKVAGSWQFVTTLGSQPYGGSGYSVAIDNGIIAIGEGDQLGMVLYRRGTTGWAQIARYVNGTGLSDDGYYSPRVDITQNYAIHSNWGFDTDPTAYIYKPAAGGNWAQATVTALPWPGDPETWDGWTEDVNIAGNTAVVDGHVYRANTAGQWQLEARVPDAVTLDDDGVTIMGIPGILRGSARSFRHSQLYRRNAAGTAWPVRAELAASDEAVFRSVRTDGGRVLLASYQNNAAYVYELPTNLDRNALAQDDFQDGDAIGWATTPGSSFAVATSGTARFYRQTNTTGNAAALWQASIGSDQSIQADITPRAFDGADRWFGLVTRYTDANNYYYVTARSGGGIQLKRMLGGTFTTLGSAALPVAIGSTNRIRLESVADHIRVLVNNRPVIRVRDSALTGGQPGIMMYRTQADFDNVLVNPNPAFTVFERFQRWRAVAGTWSSVDIGTTSVYRQTDLTGGARLLAWTENVGDQIVEADLRPTQFSGADRWVGLIARYRDDTNYHYATLRSSGSLDIKKLADGAIQTLASVPFTVQPNVSYRVRLETIGTSVRVYVNGTLRAEVTDASITPVASTAGVATYKATLDLDNFALTHP